MVVTLKLLLFIVAFLVLVPLVKTVQAVDLPQPALNHIPVCPPGNPETPRCHARVVTNKNGKPQATVSPTGLTPQQFLAAYSLSGSTAVNRTIAIIDAYDDSSALADLNVFSSTFGLLQMNNCPVSTGTVSSPCFQKVDQNGGNNYPAVDSGWALETSLDIQTAHSLCQNCNILLVEASSSTYANLMAAVDQAVIMGANVVSNSYGSGEFSSQTLFDSHFNIPGVAFTFSSGDNGYGTSY